MSPIIKKAVFRMKKQKRPFESNEERKKSLITKGLIRGLVAVFIVLAIVGIIYSAKLPIRTSLNKGDVAAADIYAPFDFSYTAGIDEEATSERQHAAVVKVLDVYSLSSIGLEKAQADAEGLFDYLLAAKASGRELDESDMQHIKKDFSVSIGLTGIKALSAYPDINFLKTETVSLIAKLYQQPIISDDLRKVLIKSKKDKLQVYDKNTRNKLLKSLDDINSIADIRKTTDSLVSQSGIDDKDVKKLIYKLLAGWISPNLIFDSEETDAEVEAVKSLVAPIYSLLERAKGEIIIRKGQRVTNDHIAQLDRVLTSPAAGDTFSQFWGIVVLMLLLGFLLFIYLKDFEPDIFSEDKLLLLIGLMIFFAAASARIIVSSPLSSYLVPVAAISMLLVLLVNGGVAAIVVLAASIIVALIAGVKFNIFLVSMVGGIAAICTVNNARHRSQIVRAGLYVGILNFITICALGILSNFEAQVFLKQGLWGIASGIISAAITMIFLPILESAFKLTTDIKLLELADLNHPLLKTMVTGATGTYHHSLVVGNLAEAAADAIDANSLLARIGSYYHDIGKIEKSEYFAENKQVSTDIHQGLSPSMSSLIITNHVKDGVELAEKHKLGSALKDIIEQHHGTSLITYFYHQAVEKSQAEGLISEEGFRYLGPKPQTKESAIVMLSDSVEAASRVLQNPTPQRLKELVRKIVNNKFIDRQLDECSLTLKDISKIAASFVKILTGIYHSRVEYPSKNVKKNGNSNNKQPKKDKA